MVAPRLFSVARFDGPTHLLKVHVKRLSHVNHNETPLSLDGQTLELLATEIDVNTPTSSAGSMDTEADWPVIAIHPNQQTFELPDERTPLLARAFEAAGQRVRTGSSLISLITNEARQVATG